MKIHKSRIMMLVLIGILFLSISNVYAQTAEDYYNQGSAKYASDDMQGAIADYTQAIALNPQYWQAYEGRAAAKNVLGDSAGANADYQMVYKLHPSPSDDSAFGF